MRIFTKRKFSSKVFFTAVILSLSTTCAFAQNAGVIRNDRDNTPKSITLPPGSNYTPGDAQAIFSQYLDINKATDELRFVNTSSGKMGVSVDRYHQYFKGIKIDRSAYTVLSKDGKVSFLTGNFYKTDPSMSTTPMLTEAQAFDKALQYIGAQTYMWQDAGEEATFKQTFGADTSYLPKAKLVYIEKMSAAGGDGKLYLAYSFDIYAKAPLSRDIVYVNAQNGEILHKNPQIKHTNATGATLYSAIRPIVTGHVGVNYFLHDSTRGNGIFTYDANNTTSYTNTNFVNSVLNWATPDAGIDAHWGAEMVYDYWITEHGRNSFDDAGAAIRSYVHYDVNYNNAFWDGIRMTYGDGTGTGNGGFDPLTSIDVVAHEIGHAVCTYTSDLDYVAESGGMNEGFSDIWGAVIENWSNPFEVDAEPKDIWRIGEEISNSALRSMSNPNAHGDPDTYGGTNWVPVGGPCNSGNDYCGVHSNSGVLNKWFYILTVGEAGTNDNGDAYNVTGLGFSTAALIAYNTEQALVNNSTFADARVAAINYANTVWGPCSPQAQAVTNAWYAVGVGTQFVVCIPTIQFGTTSTTISEWNNTTVCPSSKIVNIPVTINAGPTGGNPTVAVNVVAGNAVAGVDYVMTSGTLTFNAGSTTTQNVTLQIFDDGAVNDDTYLKLQLVLSVNGSDAVLNTAADTIHIDIDNQDNAPNAGSVNTHTVLTNTTTSNGGSPFQSSNRRMRLQYLLTAADLAASGLVVGNPLNSIAFNVITKNSGVVPFTGFTVSLANTAATTIPAIVTTGLTQVYTGDVTTTTGWNTLPFQTNYVWTGGSLIVNVCFNNTTNIANNDVCQGFQTGTTYNIYNKNNGATSLCATTTTSGSSTVRPVTRFGQITPGTAIESTNGSSRIWNVRSGTEVYFYSAADSQLIAGLNTISNDLGCVTANLSGAGNGFAPSVYGGTSRSLKEFTITPTINGSTTNYTATVYMTPAELNGVAANTLFLVKTNEPTDATINMGNSVLLTPTVTSLPSFTAFSGTFTGFSRYYLTDGPLPPPVPVITPVGPTTVCPNTIVQLNGNTATGVSYSWLRNGILIPGATSSSYNATLAGDYQFIMTNSVAVSDTSAIVTITHNPLPNVVISPSGTVNICAGDNVQLSAATGTGYSYQWRNNNSILPGATTSSFTATGSGFYDVVITALGCPDTSLQTHVIVNANPVAIANANTPVCTGSSLNLTATSVAGVTYAWTGPNGFNSAIQNPQINNVQAINGGSYYLTITNSTTGCVGMDTVVVTTQNGTPPAQPASISGADPVCSGVSETYTAPAVAGASSYTWTFPGGWIGTSTTNSITVTTGTFSGNITVTANNSCGSGLPQTKPVSVNVTPNTPGVIGSIVYCLNEPPAQLTATGTNLQWYDVPTGGTASTVAPTPTTNTLGTTPFYVSQNDGICESQRSIILVTVNPLPVVNVTQVGNTFTADGAFPFYQWYLDGVLIIGATSQVYTATQNGSYTVMASDINGCSFTTMPIMVTDIPVSVGNTVVSEPRFYPNPTTGICWLELPSTSDKTEILITDIAGKVIHRSVVKDQAKIPFDLSKAARGIYMVKVVTTEKTYTSRITLQ